MTDQRHGNLTLAQRQPLVRRPGHGGNIGSTYTIANYTER